MERAWRGQTVDRHPGASIMNAPPFGATLGEHLARHSPRSARSARLLVGSRLDHPETAEDCHDRATKLASCR